MKVILLMALTLDGKIGKDSDHFPDWTGKEDKRLFVEVTKRAGCLIMGSKTFNTIGKPLPDRRNIIMTRKQRHSQWENLEFTSQSPKHILQQLENEGFSEVVLAGGAQINTLFAQENLIDEVIVTISPLVFGEGISLFGPEVSMELELLDVEQKGDRLIVAHYAVKK